VYRLTTTRSVLGELGTVGLDTTHDCWHGSYTNFTLWRNQIARSAGYTVTAHPDKPWATIDIPGIRFKPENFQGEWGGGPPVEDPLVYLIVHSDIDGVIHPSEGRHLAARLEQLLPVLTIEGASQAAERYEQFLPGLTLGRMSHEALVKATLRFIKGLREAADSDDDVVFF